MINILITGAHGFLGRTLKKNLNQYSNIRILEYCRDDSDKLLNEFIKLADFIYHFAGEVRPNSSERAFESSNLELTQKIIDALSYQNKKTPLLYTSTIHAIDPKNTYGQTKQKSEKIIEAYSQGNNISAWIYRLPHVFGPGCKPNYNSVLSTWIFNSLNGLEINVFNRDTTMRYCYSENLIKGFVSHIYNQTKKDCFYVLPENIYDTTLGTVVDLIQKFQLSKSIKMSDFTKDSFEEKLFMTYESYMLKNMSITEISITHNS